MGILTAEIDLVLVSGTKDPGFQDGGFEGELQKECWERPGFLASNFFL